MRRTITASYGYDIHSIDVDEATTRAAIGAGKRMEIDGQGFMHEEDGPQQDHWVFNNAPNEIYFYLDNGAEFFCEKI